MLQWWVKRDASLNASERAYLLTRYGYDADPTHTRYAEICVGEESDDGVTVIVEFPMSFVLATAQTGDMLAEIGDAVRAQVVAYRNTLPLTAIRGRRFNIL